MGRPGPGVAAHGADLPVLTGVMAPRHRVVPDIQPVLIVVGVERAGMPVLLGVALPAAGRGVARGRDHHRHVIAADGAGLDAGARRRGGGLLGNDRLGELVLLHIDPLPALGAGLPVVRRVVLIVAQRVGLDGDLHVVLPEIAHRTDAVPHARPCAGGGRVLNHLAVSMGRLGAGQHLPALTAYLPVHIVADAPARLGRVILVRGRLLRAVLTRLYRGGGNGRTRQHQRCQRQRGQPFSPKLSHLFPPLHARIRLHNICLKHT